MPTTIDVKPRSAAKRITPSGVGNFNEIVFIPPELDRLPFVGLQVRQCRSKVLGDA